MCNPQSILSYSCTFPRPLLDTKWFVRLMVAFCYGLLASEVLSFPDNLKGNSANHCSKHPGKSTDLLCTYTFNHLSSLSGQIQGEHLGDDSLMLPPVQVQGSSWSGMLQTLPLGAKMPSSCSVLLTTNSTPCRSLNVRPTSAPACQPQIRTPPETTLNMPEDCHTAIQQWLQSSCSSQSSALCSAVLISWACSLTALEGFQASTARGVRL